MPNTLKILDACRVEFERKGWTYDQLAEKSGQSKTTAYNYMTGKVEDPKRATVERFAEALNVDIDEIAIPSASMAPTHCDRCRADQNEHNRLLREDFNERFSAMKDAYEDRISHINDKFTQRIADQKERYDERHAMVLEHHKERVDKLNETITVLQNDNARMHKRNRVLIITLIILAIVVGILSVIDLSHEGIGWLPHILRLSTGAH